MSEETSSEYWERIADERGEELASLKDAVDFANYRAKWLGCEVHPVNNKKNPSVVDIIVCEHVVATLNPDGSISPGSHISNDYFRDIKLRGNTVFVNDHAPEKELAFLRARVVELEDAELIAWGLTESRKSGLGSFLYYDPIVNTYTGCDDNGDYSTVPWKRGEPIPNAARDWLRAAMTAWRERRATLDRIDKEQE